MFNSLAFKRFFRGLKIWAWKYGYSENCPLCGSKLETHGFEFYNRRYSCENLDCPFPDDIKVKKPRDDW